MKKVTFNNTYKYYKARKFHWKNDLAESLFGHGTNFYCVFLSKCFNIRGAFRTLFNISDGIFLQK